MSKVDFNPIYESEERNQIHAKYMSEISEMLSDLHTNSDIYSVVRIVSRQKDKNSFAKKAEEKSSDGSRKYPFPLRDIKDQIGFRVICIQEAKLQSIMRWVSVRFRVASVERRGEDDPERFVYRGTHGIFHVPASVRVERPKLHPVEVFEIQAKTLAMDAVAEATHSFYKKGLENLTERERRLISALEAGAWGQDYLADGLYNEQGAETETSITPLLAQ